MRNASRGTLLARHVDVADSFGARLRGLLGTRTLAASHGLLLRPCRQVHSFFMRYALDLVFVDRGGRVVQTVREFSPGRLSPFVRAAAAVLELPAGTLATAPVVAGDRLESDPHTIMASEER